jgi:hypothetical protein
VTPLSFCKNTWREISLKLWSIYFWWMDGMSCVTPDVEVRMYMWVYVISIMEAWKDSTKGHNNLAKLNGSEASICRRFILRYRHMALVGDMIIEELVLSEIFTILWDRARPTLSQHIILVNTLGLCCRCKTVLKFTASLRVTWCLFHQGEFSLDLSIQGSEENHQGFLSNLPV